MSCFNQKLNEVYNFLKSGRRISDRTLFSDGTNVQLFLISYREIIHNKAEAGDKKAFFVDMYNNDKKQFYFNFKLNEAYLYIKSFNFPMPSDNILFSDLTNMGLWLQNNKSKLKEMALKGNEEAAFVTQSYDNKNKLSQTDSFLESEFLKELDRQKKVKQEILAKLKDINNLEDEYLKYDDKMKRIIESIQDKKLKMKLERKRMKIAVISFNSLERTLTKFNKIFVKRQ